MAELFQADNEMFPDHDEQCHAPMDTEENRIHYQKPFIYECCDSYGDEGPRQRDWHREVRYDYSKRARY